MDNFSEFKKVFNTLKKLGSADFEKKLFIDNELDRKLSVSRP